MEVNDCRWQSEPTLTERAFRARTNPSACAKRNFNRTLAVWIRFLLLFFWDSNGLEVNDCRWQSAPTLTDVGYLRSKFIKDAWHLFRRFARERIPQPARLGSANSLLPAVSLRKKQHSVVFNLLHVILEALFLLIGEGLFQGSFAVRGFGCCNCSALY